MDKNYLVAAAVALAMAGCATSRVGPRSAELLEGDLRLLTHPPKCEVGVYVDDDKYILIDQEPVHVRGCATARTVVWKVDGSYKFAAAGIKLKTPTTSPPGPICTRSSSGKQYSCTFSEGAADPAGVRFPYTITLTRNDGSAFGSLDPMMINY